MSVQELEQAVESLQPGELAQFAEWFARHHADKWDEQIADDARVGKLADLTDRANRDFDAGNVRRL